MNEKKEKLEEFTELMEKILDEKTEKYKDSYKTSTLGDLRAKIHSQLRTLVLVKDGELKERAKRKLIHIANFAYLIYNRL